MAIEKARLYLKKWNKDQDILEFAVSSATVELASAALNTVPGRIAKSLTFMVEKKGIMVIAAGDTRIDNAKFKKEFGCKAIMLAPEEVPRIIGHEIGGVCPFGINPQVEVFLDESLRRFDFVFPACGSPRSGIKLFLDELEEISGSLRWVDVCKPKVPA